MNKIIVLCGKSSAGKDKIAKYLSENHSYKFIVSTTSRPIRPNESQGNPYKFITRQEFEDKIKARDFIECRQYNTLVNNIPDTWYYGVEESEVDIKNNNYVVVLDIQGLQDFKRYFGDHVISFYIDVDNDIRKDRAMQRGGFDETEWNRRLIDDAKVFSLLEVYNKVDFISPNYNFDECIKDILDIIGTFDREEDLLSKD